MVGCVAAAQNEGSVTLRNSKSATRRDSVSAPEELLADVLNVLQKMTAAVADGTDLTDLVERRGQLYQEVEAAASQWDLTGIDADSWRAALSKAELRLARVLDVAFERSESDVLSQRRVRSATRLYQR
ncbi:MAG: hypothetical protein ACI81R_002188 [Bradymonadia bacterium]|jgi:hypothetical protein